MTAVAALTQVQVVVDHIMLLTQLQRLTKPKDLALIFLKMSYSFSVTKDLELEQVRCSTIHTFY